MMWVVIGHNYSLLVDPSAGAINITNFKEIANKPFFLILEAGLLSVDVFFALGGFFLAFIMLRNIITLKLCGLAIIQRVLRVWPAYILVMMFEYSLFMRLGSGVVWSKGEFVVELCTSMWKEILFVGNFVYNGSKPCMGWGWYLQVDFQLFVVGVFLLYLYSKAKKISLLTFLLFAISSTLYIFIFTFVKDIKIMTDLIDDNPNEQQFS